MSAFTSLKMVAVKRPVKTTDVVLRRNKTITKLLEQIELAKIMLGQNGIAPTKLLTEIDEETGEKVSVKVKKRVKEWFFTDDAGKLCVTVRYGNKTVELAKNKTGIELSSANELVSTFEILVDAVKQGELDAQLAATSAQVKEMFKK